MPSSKPSAKPCEEAVIHTIEGRALIRAEILTTGRGADTIPNGECGAGQVGLDDIYSNSDRDIPTIESSF